jgi:hypothetical protein
MKISLKLSSLVLLTLLSAACKQSADSQAGSTTATDAGSAPTGASEPAAEGEWITLFDGKSLAGWHGFNKTGEVKNWAIEDGALVCLGAAKDAHGGDIVSDQKFGDFELTWEWKVDKGSNSGVMYHVVEDPKYKAPYETGPEYQIIDDIGFPEKLETWQQAGADYAMTVPNEKKKLKPVGEWNSSKIVYNKGHVEHWLNNEKIVEFEVNSPEWKKEKAEGKWKDYPDYASAQTGAIALQDHGNKAYFKNIKIKQL